ncbi:tyrosine-type recombinase/integrase [Carbonactinospora thermoautotrophica]|uniref:tyrosine-type recombinase/integrase n=1 Tax=Carbonactinospora thermoautotrophica TaxID=1469144 RepID=UPI00082C62E1|nr:tyrosine-type recombinase/integrase [Carbonactinospora thermoautotrophica]
MPKDLGPFERTAKISFVLSLQAEGRSPHTVTTYRRAVSLLAGWLLAQESGPRRWADVTRDDLEAFFADLLRDHRPGTARTYHSCLSAFFRWLHERGDIDHNPMRRVPRPRVPSKIVPVLTNDELRQLLRPPRGRRFTELRDYAIVRVFLATGLRLSGVARLLVEDVDLPARRIRTIAKGGHEIRVPIDSKTALSIDRYLDAREKHPLAHLPELWLGARGHGALTSIGVYRAIKRRYPNVHPHRFRHTFADRWLARGGSEQDLMEIAGWRTHDMLRRYTAANRRERALTNYDRVNPLGGL